MLRLVITTNNYHFYPITLPYSNKHRYIKVKLLPYWHNYYEISLWSTHLVPPSLLINPNSYPRLSIFTPNILLELTNKPSNLQQSFY